MNVKEKTKRLVGRTIVKAEPRSFESGRVGFGERWAHHWRLTLDDGTRVHFRVEETEIGEYGIDIHLTDPTEEKKTHA